MLRPGFVAGVCVGAISRPAVPPGEATTPNFELWEPWTIGLVSGAEEYPIILEGFFPPEALETDYVRIQVRSLPSLTEVLNVRVLVGTGDQSFPGLSSISTGSHTIRQRLERGIYYGDWTNSVEHGPDVVAPVLSSPTGVATGTTTADLSVVTDEANGTMYYVVSTSSTKPSEAQMEAGEMHTGTAAAESIALPVTEAGEQVADATGLPSGTALYPHFMHKDDAGNLSAIVTGASFATDAAAAFSLTQTAAPPSQVLGGSDFTYENVSIGAADPDRHILVFVSGYCGSVSPVAVTVGGIAANKITGGTTNQSWGYLAAVPTGTTADIYVETYSPDCRIHVMRLVGADPTPTAVTYLNQEWRHPPRDVAVNTPAGGATAILTTAYTPAGTSVYTGATVQGTTNGSESSSSTAIRTTAGAATVSETGMNGGNESDMIAIGFAP